MLTFCPENSGPFQLHHAHVRKDTRLSPCNHVLEWEQGFCFLNTSCLRQTWGYIHVMLGGGRKTIKTFTGFHLQKCLGGSILKNKKFGGVAFCTILISELSHHVRATFCATFGILFPYVLSLETTYALMM